VAGGVFASKARQVRIFYADDGSGDCIILTQLTLTTTSSTAPGAFPTRLRTASTTGLCPITWVRVTL
jgi:hypothetical protein